MMHFLFALLGILALQAQPGGFKTSLDITTFSGCAQVLVRSRAGQTGPVRVTVGQQTLQELTF